MPVAVEVGVTVEHKALRPAEMAEQVEERAAFQEKTEITGLQWMVKVDAAEKAVTILAAAVAVETTVEAAGVRV